MSSFWIELVVLLILAYYSSGLALILGALWFVAQLTSPDKHEAHPEKLYEYLDKRFDSLEEKIRNEWDKERFRNHS